MKRQQVNDELIKEYDLITVKELMDWLKITRGTVYNWRKNDTIKAYGIGNRVYFRKKEIIKSIIAI